jgi:hypothetical protein
VTATEVALTGDAHSSALRIIEGVTIAFPPPSAEEQVKFLTNVQRLLNETSTNATYKHALLLALADLAVEHGWDGGISPTIEITAIAEKFIAYYWRQVRPFPSREGAARVLKQNAGDQAKIVKLLEPEYARHHGSLASLRRSSRTYAVLVREVAAVVKQQPLWRLQRVGRRAEEVLDFLYPNTEGGTAIQLRLGVGFCLRRFHGLIESAVRASWVRFVRDLDDNASLVGATASLDEFLFGSQRGDLSAYPAILAPLQEGRCLYCDRALAEQVDVDHFVPWSLYPVDLAHNFVLAHRKCNQAKGDRLGAIEHLRRWVVRNRSREGELAAAFDAASLVHGLSTSETVAAWAYGQAEVADSQVWLRGDELCALDRDWRAALSS